MKTSDKIKSIIISQINEDVNAACENQSIGGLEYEELLDILVEVSKLEAMNQPSS
tara:strand:+ start:571 stop:735 length:165 start_codon:yes stop_codon:yes gene_type:complete